jgi:long-chain acyl-CoA synthetase
MSSLPQLIRTNVQRNGDKIATRFKDRERTWHAVQDRVARLAAGLHSLDVGEGDRVAVLALNSDRYFEFYFGTSWAGAVFVPVNNRLAPAEFVHWLNDSGSQVLFVDDNYLQAVAEIRDRLESVQHLVYMGDGDLPQGYLAYEALLNAQAPVAPSSRAGDDMAGLFYTGGTTGKSKGVMLSHRNLTYNVLQARPFIPVTADDVFLHAAPMFHLADGFFFMLGTTMGCTHVIVPTFEPKLVLQTLQDEEIKTALLVPTMINMVVNHPDISRYDLSSLRRLVYGASPMPEAVIRKAMEVIPGVDFYQAYGQTESSPVITVMGPEYHTTAGPRAGKLKGAGRVVAGIDLAILDDAGKELPVGSVGEVCIRGDNVMLGYWNLPDVTAETLRDGWLHTGDGGRLDDEGMLFIVDRVKDMIVSGGENVYSAETEQAVYAHPAVAECAVIGIPHESWGEQVHAIVRLKDGYALTAQDLIDHCKALIAGYKCPKSVEFRDEPLPLSGAGKILKKDLRAPYWAGQDRNVS